MGSPTARFREPTSGTSLTPTGLTTRRRGRMLAGRLGTMLMLERDRVLETADVVIDDVRCWHEPSGWSDSEVGSWYGVVLVRRGTFRRAVQGSEHVLDPTSLYFVRPGVEQRVSHPAGGGDRCTAVRVGRRSPRRCGAANRTFRTTRGWSSASPTAADLAARRMLAVGRSDPFDAAERAVLLITAVLAEAEPSRVAAGRPSTERARRRIVDEARQIVALDPTIGLLDLAGRVACSPHHLSRIFRAGTGETLSRYRNRVRLRVALERLAEGERSLSTLAADLGFADASHLARAIRVETGGSPARLREQLAGSVRG